MRGVSPSRRITARQEPCPPRFCPVRHSDLEIRHSLLGGTDCSSISVSTANRRLPQCATGFASASLRDGICLGGWPLNFGMARLLLSRVFCRPTENPSAWGGEVNHPQNLHCWASQQWHPRNTNDYRPASITYQCDGFRLLPRPSPRSTGARE